MKQRFRRITVCNESFHTDLVSLKVKRQDFKWNRRSSGTKWMLKKTCCLSIPVKRRHFNQVQILWERSIFWRLRACRWLLFQTFQNMPCTCSPVQYKTAESAAWDTRVSNLIKMWTHSSTFDMKWKYYIYKKYISSPLWRREDTTNTGTQYLLLLPLCVEEKKRRSNLLSYISFNQLLGFLSRYCESFTEVNPICMHDTSPTTKTSMLQENWNDTVARSTK